MNMEIVKDLRSNDQIILINEQDGNENNGWFTNM